MNLGKQGMRGTAAGGVTVYPMAPWLASQARKAAAARRPARHHSASHHSASHHGATHQTTGRQRP